MGRKATPAVFSMATSCSVFEQDVKDEGCRYASSPPQQEEGWTRHQEEAAKPPLMERTGWCGQEILDHTTPSARANVASQLSLDRASTPPPAEEGSRCRTFRSVTIIWTALLAEVVFSLDEDGAGFAAIRRSDDARALHAVEQAGGAAVADAQTALQRGSRRLAHLQHDAHGVIVELVEFAVAGRARPPALPPELRECFRCTPACLAPSGSRRPSSLPPPSPAIRERASGGTSPAAGTACRRARAAVRRRWNRESCASPLSMSTRNEMRAGKFALINPVMTSTDGRCVARIRWMPTARAICARRVIDSSTSRAAVIMRSASSSMTITM